MKNEFAVIMAGGKGERFWPLSTSRRPKQVLSIVGGKPLISIAVERLGGLIKPDNVFVITTASLVPAIRAVVPGVPRANIIGEPVGRDTAAAVALASAVVRSRSPDGVFCILTADHLIGPRKVFQETIRNCLQKAAMEDVLITIGIEPKCPSTGYGYIEAGHGGKAVGKTGFLKALRFVEKPDLKTAERYLTSGKYFWNSGMFAWSVTAIQNALLKHRSVLYRMARRIEPVVGTSRFNAVLAREYGRLEKISVDYAVMEKARNILMAKCNFDWDDVGSWAAIENHFKKDGDGNVRIGKCESIDSRGNIVVAGNRLTGLIGVDDLIVVQAENATLVCRKDKAEDVKKLVSLLKDNGAYQDLL